MDLINKNELVEAIKYIGCQGWYPSVKRTLDIRNDGAVGNTLEILLGVDENNLPIPNAREWELKGQRLHTSSLVTLKHKDPSPTACSIVTQLLCPFYGWPHREAGIHYPADEMSFRSTTSATQFTNRGFRILVDREQEKIRFVFDYTKADTRDPNILQWLDSVNERIGLGPLNPEPYWGFADIEYSLGTKLNNCFYVIADSKNVNGHEYFKYVQLKILAEFVFEYFLDCLDQGSAFIDFDARTHHNHGTKFRIKQVNFPNLYSEVTTIPLI